MPFRLPVEPTGRRRYPGDERNPRERTLSTELPSGRTRQGPDARDLTWVNRVQPSAACHGGVAGRPSSAQPEQFEARAAFSFWAGALIRMFSDEHQAAAGLQGRRQLLATE